MQPHVDDGTDGCLTSDKGSAKKISMQISRYEANPQPP